MGQEPEDTRTLVLLFAENSFEHVTSLSSKDRAEAFAIGVVEGANFYGAGSCGAYVMPDEEAAMRSEESAPEVERALREMREYAAKQDPPIVLT